jgi:hypothetical protein
MNLKKLTDQARKHADKLIEQRGGQDALKRDAQQVTEAFKGKGSMSEKAKKAADAVKKPG